MKQVMFTKRWAFLAIATLLSSAIWAQGIVFETGSWEEVLAKAKQEEKVIFVDAYASWCGPCKMMANTVFTQAQVGEFFNRSFINFKIDMEKGEGPKFGRTYPVGAYPTLFFIDYDGKQLRKVVGAQQVKSLLNLGQAVLSSVDRSGQYAEAYEAGNRDPELVYNYIRALNQAGKSSLRIANDYFRDDRDWTSPFNLRMLLEATTEADSRLFNLLMQNRPAVEKTTSAEAVTDRIRVACKATLKKGLEFQSTELVEEAKAKMAQHDPATSKAFAAKADMGMALQQNDSKAYLKAGKAYLRETDTEDAAEIQRIGKETLEKFGSEKAALPLAADLFKAAADRGGNGYYFMEYAQVLKAIGDTKGAIEAAKRAQELAKEDEIELIRRADQLINNKN